MERHQLPLQSQVHERNPLMTVNAAIWRKFPVADRNQGFSADAAIKRIQQVAAGSVETFNMAFLWRSDTEPPNNKNSYRLPIADVINGRMTLIPHAVFTAAAILQGANGGLEGVVGEGEKKQLRRVVSQIYGVLRDTYGDPRVVPPWERQDTPPNDRPNRQITASVVNHDVATLPKGPDGPWSSAAATNRLWEWADGDYRQYRKGFLVWDTRAPENRTSYRYPVADVVDGELALVRQGVATAASMLVFHPASVDVPHTVMPEFEALVSEIQALYEKEDEEEAMTAAAPVRPPAHWFDDPMLEGPTPLTVTADGQVKGHLALWNVCHFGMQDVCRMAPHSNTNYQYFMTGSVLTADGTQRKVGRITLGTGHANLRLGYVPAADHYDNTGTAAAVVAAGEDRFGPWVAGATVPGLPESKIAELRRSPLSGDWRPTPRGLELVAALAVNTPGFPVVGLNADGSVQSLVAAGMVLSQDEIDAINGPGVTQLPAEVAQGPNEAVLERLRKFQEKADRLTKRARSQRLDDILRRGA
jgi:hypothetical protein